MSLFTSEPIVIDGKGHLLGRLASILAKQVSLGVMIVGRSGQSGRSSERGLEDFAVGGSGSC